MTQKSFYSVFSVSVCFIFLLTACAPDLGTPTPISEEPTPDGARLSSDFPGVVFGVEATQDGYILNDTHICLALHGDAFWERGNMWDSPDDLPRLEVRLNDQPVSPLQLAMSPPIVPISDGRGGTIGSTPSGYTYCFSTSDLASGRYTVDMVATSNSGFLRQYTWDLIVR
jgi:hypothetical protein